MYIRVVEKNICSERRYLIKCLLFDPLFQIFGRKLLEVNVRSKLLNKKCTVYDITQYIRDIKLLLITTLHEWTGENIQFSTTITHQQFLLNVSPISLYY